MEIRPKSINIVAILIIVFCGVEIGKILWWPQIRGVTAENIQVTVEKVESFESDSVIYLNVTNTDGSIFEEDTEIGSFEIDSSGTLGSWETVHELSEDRKTLMYKICIRHGRNYEGDKIEIKARNIVRAAYGEEVLKESVAELCKTHFLEESYRDEVAGEKYQKITGEKPLTEIDEFTLMGAGFSDSYECEETGRKGDKQCLFLRTSLVAPMNSKGSEAHLSHLYDEATSTKIYSFLGSTMTDRQENDFSEKAETRTDIHESFFELTDTNKLEHIMPVIQYTVRDNLVAEEWKLRIKL